MINAKEAAEKLASLPPKDRMWSLLVKIPKHTLEILNSAVEWAISDTKNSINIILSCDDVRLPADLVKEYKKLWLDSDIIDYSYDAAWRVSSKTLKEYLVILGYNNVSIKDNVASKEEYGWGGLINVWVKFHF